MESRLDESRANIIREAIRNDGMFCGSAEWLESHHISKDEFETFLEYPAQLARMYDWRESNMTTGAVEVELTFTKHSGKVGSSEEQWTTFAPQSETSKILRVAETGPVIAQLFPKQMPLNLDDQYAIVNTETGELV